MRSTSLHGEEEHREHRVSLQRHRLPRECVAYIQPCRYDAWLWLPPQDPAAKPPPNRRPLWLPLHCAAARQEASLRFVPRQPNPQKKEQHQENYHASLPASFSPYSSLIKGTKNCPRDVGTEGLRQVVDSTAGDVVQLVRTLPCRWLESYAVTAALLLGVIINIYRPISPH